MNIEIRYSTVDDVKVIEASFETMAECVAFAEIEHGIRNVERVDVGTFRGDMISANGVHYFPTITITN